MLTVHTKGEGETLNLGFKIGKNIFSPSVIALIGELGSGKTIFTQGIAKGMGIKARVRSPSFVIINEYPAACPLYHFDLYRLDEPHQLDEVGYKEYFFTSGGVVVIEWADKIVNFLPAEYLEVKLQIKDFNLREVVLIPKGNKKYHKLIRDIKREIQC